MKKSVYNINMEYAFVPSHKGAPYTFNGGESFVNHGEFCEVLTKSVLGYAPIKDANASYDKASDIAELRASVKSSKATLVNKPLGYDFASFKAHYMATVHSTTWIWASEKGEEITLYYMDANEFSDFVNAWAVWANDRKVIRFKVESGKMLQWLDSRVTD